MGKRDINKLELSKALSLNMDRTLQSGANMHKGDMYDDVFMLDLKSTKAKTQITIKRSDLIKADLDALSYNPPLIPGILMSIDGDFDRVIISVDDFKYFRSLVRKERMNGTDNQTVT
jgi:hypothetical protein